MKREVYNLEILYRKVKICKTCFVLYSMIAKEFDNTLKKDLKSITLISNIVKSWDSLPNLGEHQFSIKSSDNQIYKKSIKESDEDAVMESNDPSK